jgi:hypothetical protein
LSIGASQTDFTAPSGSSTPVTSASAGTFTGQASGSGHTASTAVGGTTVVPDYNVFSAGTGPNAVSGSGSAIVNLATPFTLSNVLNFALNPGATDNFSEAAAIGTPSVGSLLSPPSSPAPSASSNLTLSVDVGGITIPIDFNSAFALAGGSPNQVTVDTALLNTALVAIGSAYNFTTLGASSNDPGGTTAQINLDGSLTSANPGLFSFLSVTASQGGFTAPAGGSLTLTDASAATYIGQASGGGHTAFGGIISGTSVSAFNVFSTGTGLDAATGSGSAGVSPSSPYGLFNTLNFALSPGATDNFSGAVGVGTTTLGPPGTAVPEPSTFALTGIGLGAAGLISLRRRGRRNPA